MTRSPRPPARRPPAARPIGRRGPGAVPMRRSRSISRASAGLAPVRAGAMLAMLLSAAAVYGVGNSGVFTYGRVSVEGATFTDPGSVVSAVDAARGQNLFRLDTGPLEAEVRKLPAVRAVEVTVRLPDTIAVRIEERTAILVWRLGARRYLVDRDGTIFARLEEERPASAAALPVVEDRRAASAGLSVGRTIDPIDLDAATRLASLVPTDVGSEAEGLLLHINDANGFVLRTRPASWQAVFGFYTPTLRTPELVPGQVRLLRSLLIGREATVDKVILASETDGTYTTKATPRASAAP